MKSFPWFLLIILITVYSCSNNSDQIIGIWECTSYEAPKTITNSSSPAAFGTDVVKSEIVSDSLILHEDLTYVKHNSALGMSNKTWGEYTIRDGGGILHLMKNPAAPGTEREAIFHIIELDADQLILQDNFGFQFTYQRKEEQVD